MRRSGLAVTSGPGGERVASGDGARVGSVGSLVGAEVAAGRRVVVHRCNAPGEAVLLQDHPRGFWVVGGLLQAAHEQDGLALTGLAQAAFTTCGPASRYAAAWPVPLSISSAVSGPPRMSGPGSVEWSLYWVQRKQCSPLLGSFHVLSAKASHKTVSCSLLCGAAVHGEVLRERRRGPPRRWRGPVAWPDHAPLQRALPSLPM